jgi:hypothetical protein
VLDVIRWCQIQPDTSVALNTGRPEHLRAQTLQSLNALGEEYRVEFCSELLHMNPRGWEDGVAQTKVAALTAFRDAGYRVFAVVDNEPDNIRAMAESDVACEILFLHAATLYESAGTPTPRTVSAGAYDITALVSEREVPQHVQMVWHGRQRRVEPPAVPRITGDVGRVRPARRPTRAAGAPSRLLRGHAVAD